MDCVQREKTPNSDAIVNDFLTIRDVLKDSNRYFENSIHLKSDIGMHEDHNNVKELYERSLSALELINKLIETTSTECEVTERQHLQNDNSNIATEPSRHTSYLDMSMKTFNRFEDVTKPNENLNRNDYVDVIGKTIKDFTDDDNIYDNYIVERNKSAISIKETALNPNCHKNVETNNDEKLKCPFIGLPAAHLTIMRSPKVGWLTMHLRGKRFIHHFSINFKRKYYAGMVTKHTETTEPCEWWLLMYAGGPTELKPTVCLPLNRFEVHADHLRNANDNDNERSKCEGKPNPCKFELNEKFNAKNPKTYCFVAETPEHCEHWVSLLKQLSLGLPYIESTFITTAQIRKLPMLPLSVKNVDTVDTNDTKIKARFNAEDTIWNYSEGVYEEPEDYYKNVQSTTTTTTTTMMMTSTPQLPTKVMSQTIGLAIRSNEIASIYDTPKKPIRKTDDARHYDSISIHDDANNQEIKRLNINDEIELTDSDAAAKYSAYSGRKANDDEEMRIIENSPSKYQLSTMRKWLFSNHFSKLRQPTNSTNFGRIESTTAETTTAATTTTTTTSKSLLSQPHKINPIAPSTDGLKRTFSVQPKGTKVHMIINQLEANGQLTLLSGGGSSNSGNTTTNKCIALA